ncbi:MAG TPA: LysM peptidoglycan-binding domain-containing protein [Opitutaceae bacterium]|nr:LysM peptidoglycan-binding domain-containing protein [Opitutaceae bacterium]
MLPRIFWLMVAVAAVPAASAQVELANLREDVRGMAQRVGELSLRVEQLERENAALRQSSQGLNQTYVTLTQLNNTVADLNAAIRTAVAASKNETLQQVGTQMEKLAKLTNASIESLAKGMATRPVVQATFSEEYSKEGVSYTVQKGDTIAEIAKKTGARQQDIINANKLSDPSRIVVGQTLFIPGGK